MRAAFDLPALAERIKVIAKTYKPNNNNNNNNNSSRNTRSNSSNNNNSSSNNNNSNSNSNSNNSNNSAADDDDQNLLKGLIGSLVVNNMAKDKSYWGRAGIRMVPASDFERCYTNNAKVLGRGAYGKFMSVTADSCIRGIPPGVKNVGVKTEYIKNYYHPNQSPEAVIDAFRLAKRAAKIGVGPEIYDVFITTDFRGKAIIVKVAQIIDGKTWQNTEWETPEHQHAAAEALKILIRKMNEAGIIHHDLHGGNVMIDKSGRVYIIDYDQAKFSKNEEVKRISEFNSSFPDEYEAVGIASKEGIKYVYDKLVEEGSLKEAQSGGKRSKTRKARK
jgi:predicted Ser/Thr protein kinase